MDFLAEIENIFRDEFAKMAENEGHIEILIRNRFHLVQHLQVERPFLLNYLLSESIFDRNDYDLVCSEKTREQKACKVLDILETKGENGFKHFKDALQLINPNLYETLTGEKATFRKNIMSICFVCLLYMIMKSDSTVLLTLSVLSLLMLRFIY